jgi:hypothetical protein
MQLFFSGIIANGSDASGCFGNETDKNSYA